MRVAVFGSTGPAGQLVVERALADGHEVVAYARDPGKLSPRARLTLVQGTLGEPAKIAQAVAGAEAIISLLGPGTKVTRGELSGGVAHLLAAAEAHGVKRVIVLVTPSVTAAEDRRDLLFGALVAMVKLAVRPAYDEIVAIGELVRRSPLDWTLVRVPLLTNGPATGHVRAGSLGQGLVRARLSRADLASFMVGQLTDRTWSRQAPAISS